MGKGGLEPPRLAALVPKTSVAAITPLPLETASIIPADWRERESMVTLFLEEVYFQVPNFRKEQIEQDIWQMK